MVDGGLYCLCELGLTPSAAYLAFVANLTSASGELEEQRVDTTRLAIFLSAALVVGLVPGIIACLCAKKAADWKSRVRTRGPRAMLTAGWPSVACS